MSTRFLFRQTDNSALIVFRIFFGILITLEAWGAIFTGWIKRTLIEPQFTFNFIGLDFLQPLPGNGMYFYFFLMGCLGVLVTIGYKYRWSMAGFTTMWAAVYFMQKTSYNNHYYLLLLICIFMLIAPANRYASIDTRLNPKLKKANMPVWVKYFIILQLFIVYTYAAIAKLYPDWLDGTMPKLLMQSKANLPIIGQWLQAVWVPKVVTYYGIFFDLLVVPLLLFKPTRKFTFFAAVFFHLFNSLVFHIGIFPYLSLAFCLFFFPVKTIHKTFLKKKAFYKDSQYEIPKNAKFIAVFFGVWMFIQVALPLRHWFIKDDVLWTEEGHRLSWRMMLRSKSGTSTFIVKDKKTGKQEAIKKADYLSEKQQRRIATKPDMIWQFAQHLKKEYAKKGKAIEVYVHANVSVNGRPYTNFIDSKVDLAAEPWPYFSHAKWILPSALEKKK